MTRWLTLVATILLLTAAAVAPVLAWWPMGSGSHASPPVVSNVQISSSNGTTFGAVLTASATVSGSPTPTVSYQWQSGGVNVGTNSPTYPTVVGDVGNSIVVAVTATNTQGTDSASSSAFGPITGFTITGISLSSTTTTGSANAQVGCVTVTTNPPNSNWVGPVTITGANASNYVMTNSGHNPTCLDVGGTTINGGNPETDNINLTVTQ